MISVLKRYVGVEFVKILLLTTISLILLFHLIDLIEHADNFLTKGADMHEVLLYYAYLTPQYFVLFLPYSLLIAATITLVIRSRFNETIAMFASGVSLWSIITPILVTSAIASGIAFLANETLVPFTSLKARELNARYVKTSERAARFFQNRYWLKSGHVVISSQVLDEDTNTLYGITILSLDEKGIVTSRIDAKKGTYNGKWHLENVEELSLKESPRYRKMRQLTLQLPATFDSFFSAQKHPSDMSLQELGKYIKEIKAKGYDAHQYVVDYHGKIAYGVLTVMIVLLAAPFSLTPARKGILIASVGIAVFLGFACWGIFSITIALGKKGVLPAPLAPWIPVALVAATALLLFKRMRV